MLIRGLKNIFRYHSKKIVLATLGVACFLSDQVDLASAYSFEPFAPKKSRARRNPASVPAGDQVIHFDCSHPDNSLDVKTPFETIRFHFKNCPAQPVLTNTRLHQKLFIFPTPNAQFSTEYAYLSSGTNEFTLTTPSQELKLLVHRDDN